MEIKRYEIPGIAERPSWWQVRTGEIEDICRNVRKGKSSIEAITPWGFPVFQVVYNDYPDSSNTVNWMSAVSTSDPGIFGNKEGSLQTIVFASGIHGCSVEGIIMVLNLISLLETGADLRGKPNDRIVELANNYRLVLFPCINMDGRAVSPDHRIGGSLEECRRAGGGVWNNGKTIIWPEMKKYFPLPLEKAEHTGGYCNSAGFNIMHDGAPGNTRTSEAKALLKAVYKYKCDLLVSSFSQPENSFNGTRVPSLCSFPSCIDTFEKLSGRCHKLFAEKKISFDPESDVRVSFKLDITTAAHIASGATSFNCMFASSDVQGFDELSEVGYTFLEAIFAGGREMLFCDRKNWKKNNKSDVLNSADTGVYKLTY